jgi:hypothetical protein
MTQIADLKGSMIETLETLARGRGIEKGLTTLEQDATGRAWRF